VIALALLALPALIAAVLLIVWALLHRAETGPKPPAPESPRARIVPCPPDCSWHRSTTGRAA
jgi:hypothetical protein